jgi:hypothetical protein
MMCGGVAIGTGEQAGTRVSNASGTDCGCCCAVFDNTGSSLSLSLMTMTSGCSGGGGAARALAAGNGEVAGIDAGFCLKMHANTFTNGHFCFTNYFNSFLYFVYAVELFPLIIAY